MTRVSTPERVEPARDTASSAEVAEPAEWHESSLIRRGTRGQLVGGNRMPRRAVSADQRARLLRAVVRVAVARGYSGTTVHEVARTAGVAQKTLYVHFGGLPGTLLAACDEAFGWVLGDVERRVAAEAQWPERSRNGLRCFLEGFASVPDLAWCCFVELCAVGGAGEACRRRALRRFTAALSPSPADSERGGRMGVLDELIAGGVWHATEVAVMAGAQASLVSLLPALEEQILGWGHQRQANGYRTSRHLDLYDVR